MEHIKPPQNLTQFNTASKSLAEQSKLNSQQLSKLKDANEAANKVFKACVDFDKCTPELLAMVSEYLATLEPTMLRRVTTLKEGILLKTKFLPTVKDFHDLVEELEAKDNQFKPHTTYKKLDFGIFPEGYEHDEAKRKVFIECLELEKEFPDATHRRFKPLREEWKGSATEAALKPGGSEFKTPKEFPEHLWHTDFIQGRDA